MNYKNILEKNSKKYVCPNCNKKTFVRFINNETNEYLDYRFGRCDRESSCGYFVKPTGNIISEKLNFQPLQIKPMSTIDKSIIVTTLNYYNKNYLFKFLIKFFNKELVQATFLKYYVGNSKKWDGATVFYQIDNNLKCRTGKIMLYNIIGKRVKKPYNHITWVHKALKLEHFNLKQCLFGLHLAKNNKQVIGLVESEKTALTMNLFLPDYLWIATGSKQNLKEEMLNPIKQFNIIAYPDKSEFNDWNKKCNLLKGKGFKIICSNLVEKSTTIKGADLADIYFELDNNEIKNTLPTPTEKKILKLYSKNPAIKNLIKTFNLTDEGGNEIRF
ncbi:DUF6371 domain-containing protein [Lutibacter sp.]